MRKVRPSGTRTYPRDEFSVDSCRVCLLNFVNTPTLHLANFPCSPVTCLGYKTHFGSQSTLTFFTSSQHELRSPLAWRWKGMWIAPDPVICQAVFLRTWGPPRAITEEGGKRKGKGDLSMWLPCPGFICFTCWAFLVRSLKTVDLL